MENNDWIYVGVFLDKESKYRLLKAFGKYIPEGWITYCHHMTLVFNKHDEASQKYHDIYSIGENVTLKVTGIGKSNDALALRVATNLPSTNKITHITLAVPVGGKPVNSNYITNWKSLPEPIEVSGIIQEYKKK